MKIEMQKITEAARELPVRADVDVLVVGGGPAGLIAAQAAVEDGLKVMLIDSSISNPTFLTASGSTKVRLMCKGQGRCSLAAFLAFKRSINFCGMPLMI